MPARSRTVVPERPKPAPPPKTQPPPEAKPVRRNSALPVLLSILFVGITLAPIMVSGYMGDEGVANSVIPGALILRSSSAFDFWLEANRIMMHEHGRFIPLAFYFVPLFVYVKNLAFFKILMWLISLLPLYAFYRLVRFVSGSLPHAVLGTLLIALIVQFHPVMDPLLGFNGIWPLLVASLFASLELFARGLREERRGFILASLFLYLCCCCLYDISYSFAPMYALLAWRYAPSMRAALRAFVLVLAVPALLVITTLAIRASTGKFVTGQGAYDVHPNVTDAAHTYAVNVISGLPFTQHIMRANSPFTGVLDEDISLSLFGLVVLLAFASVLPRLPIRQTGQWSLLRDNRLTLLGLGLLFLLLPPLLISLSVKYQEYARQDGAYLQVYLEHFGSAVLLLVLLSAIIPAFQRLPRAARALSASLALLLLAGLSAANAVSNARVVLSTLPEWRDSRNMMISALRAGILRDAPEDAVIAIEHEKFPWDHPWMYSQEMGRPISVVQLEAGTQRDVVARFSGQCSMDAGRQVCEVAPERPLYFIHKHYVGERSGFVLASRARAFVLGTSGELVAALADNAVLFVTSPLLTGVGEFQVIASRCNQGSAPLACSVETLSGTQTVAASGTGSWRILQLPAGQVIEPQSLRVAMSLADRRTGSLGDVMAAEQAPELPQATSVSVDLVNGKPAWPGGEPVVLTPGQRSVNVQGWAIDGLRKEAAGGVVITIEAAEGATEQRVSVPAEYGTMRPDVATALRDPALAAVGYRALIDCSALPSGRYEMTVRAMSADRQRFFRPGPPIYLELQ